MNFLKKIIKYHKYYRLSLMAKIKVVLNKNNYKKKFIEYLGYFDGKLGIEIGGPSTLFSKEILPVYLLAKEIDGCNYSSNTVWEGEIKSSEYNYYAGKIGKQYILEGSNLSDIEDEKYDFLLSCHNLEHIANPIKALKEWCRVLKPNGVLLLVLPDKLFTFDRNRAYTTFSHLLEDYQNNVEESDTTHLDEILSLHDLNYDPLAGDNINAFRKRCQNNLMNRCLHHHVFSDDCIRQVFDYLELKVLSQQFLPPYHKIILGIKNA